MLLRNSMDQQLGHSSVNKCTNHSMTPYGNISDNIILVHLVIVPRDCKTNSSLSLQKKNLIPHHRKNYSINISIYMQVIVIFPSKLGIKIDENGDELPIYE